MVRNELVTWTSEQLRAAALADARAVGTNTERVLPRLILGEAGDPAPADLVQLVEEITGRDLHEELHMFARPNVARCRVELLHHGMRELIAAEPTVTRQSKVSAVAPDSVDSLALPFEGLAAWVEHNDISGEPCTYSGQLHWPTYTWHECPAGCPASRPLEGPQWMVTARCGFARAHRGHSWLYGAADQLEDAWCDGKARS